MPLLLAAITAATGAGALATVLEKATVAPGKGEAWERIEDRVEGGLQ